MIERQIIIDKNIFYSFFFQGPRKAGKSTYLHKAFPNSIYIDLLNTATVDRYTKDPHLITVDLLAKQEKGEIHGPVIIDEIQVIPKLLNEVHWLIENAKINFILCGSSARKLSHASVNMLGGRAELKRCFPLTYNELKNSEVGFDLLKVMQRGLIPSIYLNDKRYKPELKAYISVYLKNEIKNEAKVQKLNAFIDFLDSVAYSNGKLINYSNIARDSGVSSVTVKSYYEILIDTLLGTFCYPFNKSNKRSVISSTPKFYLFDVGIANSLANKKIEHIDNSNAGKSFEHFLYLEILAYINYREKFVEIHYWRTKSGIEVDFIITEGNKPITAIECKLTKNIKQKDLRGLKTFADEFPLEKLYVVSQDEHSMLFKTEKDTKIMAEHYTTFLENLWNDKIF